MPQELRTSQGNAEVEHNVDAELRTSQGNAEVQHNIDVSLTASQGNAEVEHGIDKVLYDSQGIAEIWWTPFVIGTTQGNCVMVGFFRITDGTNVIELVPNRDNAGYNLLSWTPSAPEELEIWNSAPYSDGRRLAIKKYGNTTSTFVLHISGEDPDQVIDQATDLRRLLQKGVEFWSTSWQTAPVWIEARGNCETNTRYAYILNFSAPHDDDPYIAPTGVRPSVFENFDLVIEHSHWMDGLPGTCLEVDNIQPNSLVVQDSSYPDQSSDDIYVDNAGGYFPAVSLMFGKTGGVIYSSAIRFTSVAIPQGAVISRAFLRLEQHGVGGGGTDCLITIKGEDADDAATFVSFADWAARIKTTAEESQIVPAWTDSVLYDLVDISSIIQEIVDRPGWASGNNLVIFINDNGSDNGAVREPVSWDDVPPDPSLFLPELIYEWSNADMGRDSTCLREVFFANKHNRAQLTHILEEDNVGGFSANLLLAALPTTLSLGLLDYRTYFGIDNGMGNSGPFDNLIFNTIITGANTGQWEYYNGGWVPLTTKDDTVGFTVGNALTPTVNGVYWEQPADWIPVAVNGVTGYWVRFYITNLAPGPVNQVIQKTRKVYTCITPYINIEADDVTGDISALARLKLYYESDLGLVAPTCKVLVGLRTLNRGADFSPYIHLSEVQEHPGITVVSAGGDVSIAADMQSATGLSAFWNSAATPYKLSTITIDSSVATQYSGRYRVFIRCRQNDHAIGDASVWIEGYANYQQFFKSPIVPTYTIDNIGTGINHPMILDMGIMSIPFDTLGKLGTVTIYVWGQANFASVDFYLYELILMPADEWIGEYSAISDVGFQSLDDDQLLDIDPLSLPKIYNPSNSRYSTGVNLDYQIARYKGKGISPPILQAHSDQRLWFMCYGNWPDAAPYTLDCNVYLSHMEITHSFMGTKALRYFTSRGTR